MSMQRETLRRMLRPCLLLLCLPLLGNTCDGNDGQQPAASTQQLAATGGVEGDQSPSSPIPEPSAGLVFGVGALIIYGAVRAQRNRD